MTKTAKPNGGRSRKVMASSIQRIKLLRTPERPFDAVIQITTSQGQKHFLLSELAADELGQGLQAFAAQCTTPAGHA